MSANATPTVDGVTPDTLFDKYEEAFDHLAMAETANQDKLDTIIQSNKKLVM